MIREFFWQIVARQVARPAVADWLITRAMRTPYLDIKGPDGSLYMGRWWLFNPYDDAQSVAISWLPSVRVHHIMRPDSDRHLHDHPWDARTIILRNGYTEERPNDTFNQGDELRVIQDATGHVTYREVFHREQGYTGRLLFGQFHRISHVPEEGVWTLFFTWKYRGVWGFNVNGVKVPWRQYLGKS